jgi:CheY-like chemotaxis protein
MKHIRHVRTALYEPDRSLRSAIRGVMRDVGFAEILDTGRPDDVVENIEAGNVDLVICDVLNVSNDMNETIRDIRRFKIGANPFIISIGASYDSDLQHISQTVNAGYDGVMLKPLDLSNLRKRLEFSLLARKPLVVTSSYVGPDRRKESRIDDGTQPLMIVPNPVRMIAEGMPRDLMMEHIQEAASELDERKLRGDINSVCWIADRVGAAYVAKDGQKKAKGLVRQLVALTSEIDSRLGRTAFSQVRDLCDTLVEVTRRIEMAGVEPGRKDIELLKNVAKAIKRSCDADIEDAVHVQEISESVRKKALSADISSKPRDATSPGRQASPCS